MDFTKEIWLAVVAELAAALPECEVRRTYNAVENLEALEGREKPLVTVSLDGKDSEPLNRNTVGETYHFAAVIQKYIESQETALRESEMDALLPLVAKIQDAFYLKGLNFTASNGEIFNLKFLSGDPDAGEFYDIGYYVSDELFVAAFSLSVMFFRSVNHV